MQEFAHYLEAKRTVDDRALNRRVLERLKRELAGVRTPAVADVGAGIGTGIERLVEWNIVNEPVYTGVEASPALVDIARSRLETLLEPELVASTLAAFASETGNHGRFDLVVAHAFLDIVPLSASLESLVALSRPGGLLYFPITFDGESIFEPALADDDALLARYHGSMDAGGGSRTGRRLFHALEREPVDVLEMGSSDWIVRPDSGVYPADEAYFLSSVLEMIESTVGKDAELWVSTRRRQLDEGRLLYIAHQIDCLAQKCR